MTFPITVATVPFRIPNSRHQPDIHYGELSHTIPSPLGTSFVIWLYDFPEVASDHVEGGMYIGPEFQLGQVYDGGQDPGESVVLYRPVYLCVKPKTLVKASSIDTKSPTSSRANDTPTTTARTRVNLTQDSHLDTIKSESAT